ncbi:Supporter of activation of yellow protein [Eumeta japonica]|uniref:Supporter of activation of yellow protein n=1 Tax=Eumeta variegata TaxID=151549 RepID=A0A4C1SNL0_EUMVA|nr:Supporter of activation of yellow protein [Eumeta japonica]
MSADLSQSISQSNCEQPQTPTKQPDFLNNEESQSSIISNTSILDPNNVAALQNTASGKKPMKRKKMEVCVAEDAELGVSAIAEYDWPPPKGCCPSKNRDTFMIQEQVALYLGIKSFKRKYPDLPRRQIDMEELPEDASRILSIKEDTTDTDSAAETIDLVEGDKARKMLNVSAHKDVYAENVLNMRVQNNDELKYHRCGSNIVQFY